MTKGKAVNPTCTRGKVAAHTWLALAFACLLAGKVSANPTGAEVVAGQVGLAASGNQLLITNSPGAIINWQSFSILPGELTRFIQQGSSSSVLNRITGQDPSRILGALQSNGKVFLINPNGILFGAGARVDVNGLVASALNLSNADFLGGKLKFIDAGRSGEVSNQGAITTPGGGQVYLVGSSVTNGGVITSPGGDVVLAAGHSVDLADSNNPDVRVVISAPGDRALNVGTVVAETGRVGIYGALVNQMGLVSANSAVAGANGRIFFNSSGDTILGAGSVTSATGVGGGGVIEATGSRVGLTGEAVVDVSGRTGGGTVLIGGDEHGGNPAIQNAALTYVGPMVQVKADALQSGNGGKVVVWSDQQTQMYGSISARGGSQGGNGGFVETSGKSNLDFHGVVDLRAPSGVAGTLLLDPSDITIQSGPSSGDVTVPGSAPFDITAANPTSIVSTNDLQNALGLGNVTVSTSSGASAPSGGTVTVAGPLAWSNSNTLSLSAEQGIAVNAPITAASGTLRLTTSNGDITQSGGPITAAAVAAIASNGSVELNDSGNAIAVIAGSANGAFGFSLVNSGSFTVGTVPGSGQSSAVSGIYSTAGLSFGVVLQTPSVGDITIAAPVNAGNSRALVGASGAVVQAAGGLISAGSLSVNAGSAGGVGSSGAPLQTAVGTLQSANSPGPVYLSNTGGLAVDFIDAAGAVSVSVSGSLTTPTSVACDCTNRIAGSSVVLAAAGPMQLSAGAAIAATNGVELRAGYDSTSGTYASSDTLTVDSDVSGSTVGLFAGGAITTSGALTGVVTETPSLYSAPPLAPSLAQCIATPGLSGCNAVLPTLAVCTATPSTLGCSVVLPTLAVCTTSPTVAGCSVVLPTLATCTASPTTAGCSVVLPTLAVCTTNPTTAGCSTILPTLAACAAAPTTAGCSVVLPSLAACTTNPTATGCSTVLPTLAVCAAAPTIVGCSVVLPSPAACTTNAAAAGCSAVLPTLSACTAAPTTAGCSAVLPSLAQCAAMPTLAGCSAVLPPVSICVSNPSAAGCAVVLPPTQVANTPTVVQATNNIIIAAISTTATVATTAASAPVSNSSGSEKKDESSKDTKSADKSPYEDSSKSSDAPGVSKNELVKKTFCN
jgi:filamentous hemagglutinin family protein